jgi:hypothetical protein
LKHFLGALLLFFFSASFAEARKITIVQATRVELRPSVETPDGKTEEYIVIVGNPAIIKVDEDEITADRIEYNKSTRKLRIVGTGIFQGKVDTVAGRDFEVDLASEGLTAADVFISTSEIDVQGINCERLPGQVDVQEAYFSPCSRCGTEQDAYGFKARELTLYPGDRLIARDVTILLTGQPIMYLPIVVVFLSESSRYPRLELNLDATVNPARPTVGLDLPFTVGDNGFGYWLLRYYAARTPAFGLGFDVNFVNLFGYSNKARASMMFIPPTTGTELQWAYRFSLEEMRIPLIGREPEDRWADILLNTSLTRADSGVINELRGFPSVSGNQSTRFDFSLKWSAQRFNINTQSLDEPFFDVALIANSTRTELPNPNLIRQPYQLELFFTLGKPLLPSFGGFRVSSWNWSAGFLNAPVNSTNPSANLSINPDKSKTQTNIAAFRFAFAVAVALEQPLWTGARISGGSDFAGRYYSTRNPSDPDNNPLVFDGEFERNIVFNANLGLQQTFGSWLDLGLGSRYNVSRGETPFAADQTFSSSRPGSGNLNANLNVRPTAWSSLALGQQYGFTVNFRNTTTFDGLIEPFSATLTLNPKPISLSLSASYNLETGLPVAYNLRLAAGNTGNTSFSIGFGYTFPNASNSVGTFQDLNAAVGLNTTNRAFTISLSLTQSLTTASITNTSLNSSWILGSRENPITLSLNQTFTPQTPTSTGIAPSKLNGSLGVRYTFPSSEIERPFFTGLSLSLNNNFDYAPYNAQGTTVPNSEIALIANFSGNTPLNFTFRSNLDLQTFQAYNPRLSADFTTLKGSSYEFAIEFRIRFPDRLNKEFFWENLTFRFGWDVRPGISLFGDLTYKRQLDNGIFVDTLGVNSFGVAFAFAIGGSQRPNLFFAMTVNQDFVYRDSLGYKGAALFQPTFTMIYDQCCYSLIATLKPIAPVANTTAVNYLFSLVLSLPYGNQTIIDFDRDKLRLPIVPFLEPIVLPK